MTAGSDSTDVSPADFEEGRYLFCAVYADADERFSTEGIEGKPVSLIVRNGIGVVVQPVDEMYDSDDVAQVRRWLLDHQRVVNGAGETFGTPLPFRFDTILKGDDEAVSEWLEAHEEEIADALSWLSGRWEYHIEIRWDEEAVGETLREDDDELRALADRAEEATSGTSYLLESQYETRVAERLEERRRELEASVRQDIEPYAVELRGTGGTSGRFETGDRDDLESAIQLSLLASPDHEMAIGEVLEEIAARPSHEVRYTGPWPPYSFASDVGGEW